MQRPAERLVYRPDISKISARYALKIGSVLPAVVTWFGRSKPPGIVRGPGAGLGKGRKSRGPGGRKGGPGPVHTLCTLGQMKRAPEEGNLRAIKGNFCRQIAYHKRVMGV
jgi:hypothetical protein